jgi:hypothetical protein
VWELVNMTPYKADRTWFADNDGRNFWSVAVKGTFLVQEDGSTVIADEQEDVLLIPKYFGEPGKTSPQWEADLTGPKAATDVLITGSAYSPTGRPVQALDVSVRIGNAINKQLRVYGDRVWTMITGALRPSAPEPFRSMPIKYERAFGGTDYSSEDPREHRIESRNPIGTGFAVRREHAREQQLPNIEDPAAPIREWDDRPRPVALGPIAHDWSPRRELAGTFDQAYIDTRFPVWPLDFDARYYQAAPPDQQVPQRLRGGEVIEIRNMTPNGVWRFRLPHTYISFDTEIDKEQHRHHGTIGTVTLDPETRRVIVSWQTFVSCHHQADDLDYTIIREKPFVEESAGR